MCLCLNIFPRGGLIAVLREPGRRTAHLDIALRAYRLILILREILKLLRILVRSYCILIVLSYPADMNNAGNEQNRD